MAVRDLAQFFEDDGLDYPFRPSYFETGPDGASGFPKDRMCRKADCDIDGVHGHYTVESPSAKTGLWLTALNDIAAMASAGVDLSADDVARIKLDDDGEKTLYQRVLGATYDEMLADGLKWTWLQRYGQDAYRCFATSQAAADAALLAGQGEQPARANRATRRAAKRTAGRKSSRASTAGTGSARGRPSRTSGSSTSPNGPEEAVEAV